MTDVSLSARHDKTPTNGTYNKKAPKFYNFGAFNLSKKLAS